MLEIKTQIQVIGSLTSILTKRNMTVALLYDHMQYQICCPNCICSLLHLCPDTGAYFPIKLHDGKFYNVPGLTKSWNKC